MNCSHTNQKAQPSPSLHTQPLAALVPLLTQSVSQRGWDNDLEGGGGKLSR